MILVAGQRYRAVARAPRAAAEAVNIKQNQYKAPSITSVSRSRIKAVAVITGRC